MNKTKKLKHYCGIDFGARSRCSTAICRVCTNHLRVSLVPKAQDVDRWLVNVIMEENIQQVYIDAPLSLPLKYFDHSDEASTFHHRQADLELRAMSPLFLGGLTARAITLRHEMSQHGIQFYETYPKAVRRFCFVEKASDAKILERIIKRTGYLCDVEVLSNPHAFDSVLAWYAGWRHVNGQADSAGRPEEGVILF